MADFDVEAIRRQVRALDFVRGTSADAAIWRDDDADSRANLAIEGLVLEPDEDALFDMLRDAAVPPPLAPQILLQLPGPPAADPTLAVSYMGLAPPPPHLARTPHPHPPS